MTEGGKSRPLRRTVKPSVGQASILLVVTIFLAVVSHKTSDYWTPMWGTVIIWALYAILVYIGLQYRVFWDDGVIMRASGGRERRIPYGEISEVRLERAAAAEFTAQSRPFRRIAIYGHKRRPRSYVDVSLRHFKLLDINELMSEIHNRRPDLSIPDITR
jgi:hypothetical protein